MQIKAQLLAQEECVGSSALAVSSIRNRWVAQCVVKERRAQMQ